VNNNTISRNVGDGVTVNAGTATITSNLISGNQSSGINGVAGTVIADANTITDNQNAGFYVAGTNVVSYTVTNNLVVANHGWGAYINDASATGSFAFNTVAGNITLTSGTAAGVYCGTGVARAVQYSIVVQNSADSGGTQFGGNCSLTEVVVGSDSTSGAGAIKVAPTFVGATDYHLSTSGSALTANQACCIDKIGTDPGTVNKGHDVDLSSRPKGAGWDIGAHEAM
jgi:hypothetical protein